MVLGRRAAGQPPCFWVVDRRQGQLLLRGRGGPPRDLWQGGRHAVVRPLAILSAAANAACSRVDQARACHCQQATAACARACRRNVVWEESAAGRRQRAPDGARGQRATLSTSKRRCQAHLRPAAGTLGAAGVRQPFGRGSCARYGPRHGCRACKGCRQAGKQARVAPSAVRQGHLRAAPNARQRGFVLAHCQCISCRHD